MSSIARTSATAASLLTLALSLPTHAATSVGSSSPDCSGAAASLGVIWPPNHKMVAIDIVGITDPNDLTFTISVTGILQSEPILVNGSGNTTPDGTGVGTPTALVRAERAGPGTGRYYFVSFTATNTIGAQCSGTVRTFVPHDQGQGFTPIDTGLRFDSTL